jgi:hypothetical protein
MLIILEAKPMTEHLPIQDPDGYSDEDLMSFGERLFSQTTSVDELERICMTLAHLPTEAAQRLLRRFRESPRAAEVSWLECAVDEGTYHMLSPRNELEEQEFLVLKVISEGEDKIVELSVDRDEMELQRRKLRLRQDAVKILVADGKLDPDEALGFDDALRCLDTNVAELEQQIETEETIIDYLKQTITTPRYQTADLMAMRHIHLD